MYKIHDIRELDGVTRKEEWAYRIGREVESVLPLEKGLPMILAYPDTGKAFQTTNIQDMQHEGCYVKIRTKNTMYILKEIIPLPDGLPSIRSPFESDVKETN